LTNHYINSNTSSQEGAYELLADYYLIPDLRVCSLTS